MGAAHRQGGRNRRAVAEIDAVEIAIATTAPRGMAVRGLNVTNKIKPASFQGEFFAEINSRETETRAVGPGP